MSEKKRVIVWVRRNTVKCKSCGIELGAGDIVISNQTRNTSHYCEDCGVYRNIVDQEQVDIFKYKKFIQPVAPTVVIAQKLPWE